MNHVPQLPTRLCPRHGLVAGRDGRCVICHRDDPDGDEGGALRPILGLVVAGALVVGGVVMWKGRRAPAPAAVVTSAPAAPPTPPPPAEAEGAGPSPIDETRAVARVDAEHARQRDIEASISRIPVKMYVVQKCEMCDAARTFLKEKGVHVIEVDVGESPAGLEAMHKLTPSTQVPVFDVEGEVLVGFGPTNVLGALRRAAERQNPP